MTRIRELAPDELEGLGVSRPPRIREILPDELQGLGIGEPSAPRSPGGRDLPGIGDWMTDALRAPEPSRAAPPSFDGIPASTPLDMGLPAAEGWHERPWGERALGRGYEQLRGSFEGMAAAARAQNITDVDKWLRLTEAMQRPEASKNPREYMRLSTARRMLEQDIRTALPGTYDLNNPADRARVQEQLAIRALQNIRSVGEREKTIQTEYPREPETESALNRKGESFGTALKRFGNIYAESPLKITGEIGLESALPSVAAITSGILTRSPAFAAAMMGNLSGFQEYGQGLFEVMRDAKIDTSKPEEVLAALRDPARGDEIRRLAAGKAIPVAVLDALSLGLARFPMAPARLGPVGQQLANIPAQIAAQGAAGGLGEAAGQYLQKGKIENWGEVFAEIVGEGASAPMEVLGMRGAIRDARGRLSAQPRPTVAPEAPPPALPAVPESAVAPTEPAPPLEPPPANPRDISQFPIPRRARELRPDEVAGLGIEAEQPPMRRESFGFDLDRPGYTQRPLRNDGWKAEIDYHGAAKDIIGEHTRYVNVTTPDGRTVNIDVDVRSGNLPNGDPANVASIREYAIWRAQQRLASGYQPPKPDFMPWVPESDRAQITRDYEREREAYSRGPVASRREAPQPVAPMTPPASAAPAPQIPSPPPASAQAPPRASTLPPDIPAEIYRGSGRAEQASVYRGAPVPILGPGRYFAFDREEASRFGPNIETAQIDAKNPLVIRSDEEWRALTRAAGWPFPNLFGKSEQETKGLVERLSAEIRKRGHDGVVIYWDDNTPGDIDNQGRGIKLLRNVFGKPQFFKPETETSAQLRVEPGRAAPLPPSDTAVGRATQTVQRLGANRAKVYTPQGREIEVEYELVEAGDLVTSHDDVLRPNPRFPSELQPRDRARAASEAQISEIAQRLQPERLGPSASATEGAPIVGGDNVVESGNARTMGLRRAFADYSRKLKAKQDTAKHPAKLYLDWLVSQGFSIAGMKAPVLVARRRTPLSPDDRVAFTREANESATLRMGAAELAKSDAEKVTSILDLYKGGEVSFAQNAQFVRAFMNALPASERGALWTEKGGLSQEGIRRIQAALIYAAYHDADLVAKMMESPSNDIKSIAGAMLDVAAAWAQMRQRVSKGELSPDVDRTKDLMGAVRAVEEARSKGMLVRDVLDQGSLFDEKDAKADFAAMFYNDAELKQASGRAAITTRLRKYLDEASKAEAGPNLFGQQPAGAKEILRTTKGVAEGGATFSSGIDPIEAARRLRAMLKAYSNRTGKLLDWIHNKGGYNFAPLGNLPMRKEYLAERYRMLGKTANIDKIAHGIYRVFSHATKADRKAVYAYMTTVGATPDGISNPTIREEAVRTKKLIEEVGRKLVAEGFLSQEVLDQHIGQYLPRIYLSHLFGKKVRGARVGLNLGYLKQRSQIPEDVRRLILGQITDPGFLSAKGYATPMRDLVFSEFLEFLSQNKEWMLRDSIIEWRGRKVSALWLWHEAERMKKMAMTRHNSEPDWAADVLAEAAKMEALAKPFIDKDRDMDAETLSVYAKVPDTPKYGKLRGSYIRREIWDDLFGNMGWFVESPSLLETFVGQNGVLAKLTQYWKMLKVPLNPGTVMRNFFGNFMLLQLSGVPYSRMPDLLARTLWEMANDGKYWKIAKKYGVENTNMAHHELQRLDRLARSGMTHSANPNDRIVAMIGGIADAAGRLYGRLESVAKTMKIIHAMTAENMTEEDAALAAHSAIFDYSLVQKSVRYARNSPLAAPFITFVSKVVPRLAETAVKHPWRFLPYVAMAYAVPAVMMWQLDWEEDDYDAAKEALPKFLRERGHGFFLPWRDRDGRYQWADLSSWAVWNPIAEFGNKLLKGDAGGALFSLGIGGPVGQIAMAQMTKTDPFTQRRITNPADSDWKQLTDQWTYFARVVLPPWLTDQGAVKKMQDAIQGKVDRRTGLPAVDESEAVARFLGLNVYSIDLEKSRAASIAIMRRELRDIQSRFRYVISDRNLTDADKARLREEWNARLREKADEIRKFSEKTERVTRFKPVQPRPTVQ